MLRNIILFLTFGLLPLATLEARDARQADELYRQGDYAAAIEQYESILAEGYASADLYYNLAGAYYRTDAMGPAILNYHRALRLAPAMSEARENLALAESKTVDRIAVLPRLFIVRWVDALCTYISPLGWRIVWLVLLTLTALSLVAMRLGSNRSLRKTGFIVGVVMLVLLALATWLLIRSTHRFNAHADAVVMQQSMPVKSSPEAGSVDKLILHEGTVVTVTDSLSEWYKITIADGTSGWCQASDIERI